MFGYQDQTATMRDHRWEEGKGYPEPMLEVILEITPNSVSKCMNSVLRYLHIHVKGSRVNERNMKLPLGQHCSKNRHRQDPSLDAKTCWHKLEEDHCSVLSFCCSLTSLVSNWICPVDLGKVLEVESLFPTHKDWDREKGFVPWRAVQNRGWF